MANDLLNLNVDNLFEKSSIDDVHNVLRKMRQEVERKREELRITVGYRDLIDAADTITEMKITSKEVIDHLSQVEAKLGVLKNRTLIGFQNDPKPTIEEQELAEVKMELQKYATQIKLLIELPETIWKEIDNDRMYHGAQIHQLGFHIYLGLTTFGGSESSRKDFQKWFSVVKWQKNSLLSFNEIIPKESEKRLHYAKLTPEIAADCLASVMLLKKSTSMHMLKHFFNLRLEAINRNSMQQSSTKQQLQQFLQTLVSTFDIVHALFVEGFPESQLPQAMLSERLKSASSPSSNPTIQLMNLSGFVNNQIPESIASFRPSYHECWDPLPLSVIRHECQLWFQSVKVVISNDFRKSLSCISQIKVLANLKDAAYGTLAEEDHTNRWDELTQRLLGSSVSLWNDLFEPAIIEKMETIIQDSLSSALTELTKSIQDCVTKFDLKSWLWTETPYDLPQSPPAPVNFNGIFMKTRCYFPAVQKLCTLWDLKLESLLNDLSHYQDAKESNVLFEPFNKLQKRTEICNTLSVMCQQHTLQIAEFLKRDFFREDVHLVFAMKLLMALVDLCPNMRKCVELKNDDGKTWTEFSEHIRELNLDFFQEWKAILLNKVNKTLQNHLQMNSIIESLKVTPLWDEITIQEEGEGGSAVQSQIRVPMNPSFALQQSLFQICQDLNQIGPHSIPKKGQLILMEDTGAYVLSCYDEYIKHYPKSLPQPVALQLLFDVRFLTALLVARDNKTLQEKARNLCESLEGRVDPFDLDVFNPHIQSRVKRSVQRLQFVFGPLLTAERHAILWAARLANPAESQSLESPSVITLVSTAPRVNLLPQVGLRSKEIISNIGKASEATTKETHSGHQKKPSKSKNDLASITASTARSSAAAFFEAVSSSWGTSLFGGEK